MTEALSFYTATEVADLLRLNHQVVLRKLQAGEIPGYRLDRDWRIERKQLLAWLEQRSNQRPTTSPEQKVLETYFDDAGKLREIPPKRTNREIVLRRIAAAVEPGRIYREAELNQVLRQFHHDVAWLRRELVSYKYLVRTPAGIYRRTTADPASPRAP